MSLSERGEMPYLLNINNMMKEELITYETAILAKEKGFNWETNRYFYLDQLSEFDEYDATMVNHNSSDQTSVDYMSAPTQSLLQKWLRDVHNIHVSPLMYINKKKELKWRFDLTTVSPYYSSIDKRSTKIRDTYEEALEVALYDALNSIDEKYKYDNGLGLLYNS
jgi:hypothetical protein